jgi:hypothetical protein
MPDVTELDRAVDALLDSELVVPTDSSALMTRGRARIRRRRGAGVAALATTVALAAAVIVVARPERSPNVRIGTRDDPTTSAAPTTTPAPVTHISPDSQFEATALPDGIHLRTLEVFPAQDGQPPNVMAGYADATSERISVLSIPFDAGQTPEEAIAAIAPRFGDVQHTTIDGRPALIAHSLQRPEVPFVVWAVDGSIIEIGGQNAAPVDMLTEFALGLRPAPVSQPPGLWIVRDGVLVPNSPQR